MLSHHTPHENREGKKGSGTNQTMTQHLDLLGILIISSFESP